MLSIGKLAAGQAGYYLALAGRSVDRIASVTSGVEDYYLGGPEAAGEWTGRLARQMGLVGEVDDEGLRRALQSRSPVTGELLPRSPLRVPGFDVTFSAPKRWHELRDLVRSARDAALQLQSREPEEVPRCGW